MMEATVIRTGNCFSLMNQLSPRPEGKSKGVPDKINQKKPELTKKKRKERKNEW
jgi:hypothetical protein